MTNLKPSQIRAPAGVKFHHYGLSNFDGRNKQGYELKTPLGTIRQILNHTEVVYILGIIKVYMHRLTIFTYKELRTTKPQ